MKLALVEDNSELSASFARLVAALPAHDLVASYPTAEAALAGLRPGLADLLIADLDLPGQSGIELIRQLQGSPQELPVVVWTIYECRDHVYAALKAGAIGYLLKSAGVSELDAALREFAEGGAPMSPRIARRLLRDLVDTGAPPALTKPMSARERDVLRAVARGDSHKDISARLGISMHTVHSHLRNIYKKLQVLGRSEALQRARELGLIVPG